MIALPTVLLIIGLVFLVLHINGKIPLWIPVLFILIAALVFFWR